MLVLSRRLNESIKIGDEIVIKVVNIRPGRIRLGIEAPSDVRIRRAETAFDVELPTELEIVVEEFPQACEFDQSTVPAAAC